MRMAEMGFSALKFDLDMPAANDPYIYNGRLRNGDIHRQLKLQNQLSPVVRT